MENKALLKENNEMLKGLLHFQQRSEAAANPQYKLQPIPADTAAKLELLCQSNDIVSGIVINVILVNTPSSAY